jgi:hypothetical protein
MLGRGDPRRRSFSSIGSEQIGDHHGFPNQKQLVTAPKNGYFESEPNATLIAEETQASSAARRIRADTSSSFLPAWPWALPRFEKRQIKVFHQSERSPPLDAHRCTRPPFSGDVRLFAFGMGAD